MGASVLAVIAFVLLGMLAIPILVFFVQVSLARPFLCLVPAVPSGRSSIAVLVPAHDEASVIASACSNLLAQLNETDRLVVVADNCTDDTAQRALHAGAEVIVRTDTRKVGKGFALDFGIRHIQHDPPAILVVVDADCELTPGSLDRLAESCFSSGRPVQAMYTMRNHAGAGMRMRIAEFAGIVKNQVRPLGLHRLALPCMLMGTGMAFPWKVIARADVATGHLVEDMKLGIDLAISGTPPVLCPFAEVRSFFPQTARGFDAQRTRWEHGHIGVIIDETPRLVAAAFNRKDWRLLAMALDLAVPPLALLSLLLAFAVTVAAGTALVNGRTAALWLAVALAGVLAAAIAIAWTRFGRSVVSARELMLAPVYAVVKLPLYLRFLFRRQTTWVRSERKEP